MAVTVARGEALMAAPTSCHEAAGDRYGPTALESSTRGARQTLPNPAVVECAKPEHSLPSLRTLPLAAPTTRVASRVRTTPPAILTHARRSLRAAGARGRA